MCGKIRSHCCWLLAVMARAVRWRGERVRTSTWILCTHELAATDRLKNPHRWTTWRGMRIQFHYSLTLTLTTWMASVTMAQLCGVKRKINNNFKWDFPLAKQEKWKRVLSSHHSILRLSSNVIEIFIGFSKKRDAIPCQKNLPPVCDPLLLFCWIQKVLYFIAQQQWINWSDSNTRSSY